MARITLKELRQAKGLTQKEVAAVIDVTEKTYKGYEEYKRSMSMQKAFMLCIFYNMSFDNIQWGA